MKKNFVKKLACVTAFALTVTSVAPMNASAAKAPSLNATSKTLYVGKKYDFNVKNQPTAKSTYTWTTSSKTVATVTTAGVVTAKKAGTATIKVVIKNAKTKKTTKTLTAKVTVKESATAVKISNPTDKVEVGAKVYTFKADATTKTGGKCTDKVYFVISDDTAGATVDATGVVTTTKAGEFKIKAVTATSDANFAAGKFTAQSEAATVKVPLKITSVKAIKSTTFNVAFNSAVASTLTKDDVVVSNAKTSSRSYVKSVTLSADKTTATVELYSALTSGESYKVDVKVGNDTLNTSLDFVKGTVSKITAANQIVKAGNASSVAYTVYDENGLDITADTFVTFDSTIPFVNNKVTLANGVMAYVTVVYTNTTTGVQTKSDRITVTGSNSIATSIDNYTIATSGSAVSFKTPVTSISLNATNKSLYAQVTDQLGAQTTGTNGSNVTFESLDTNVVVVDANTGAITPVAAGTGYVKIVSGSVSKVVPITVKATSVAAAIKTPATAAGSLTSGLNNPGAWISVVDQYGDAMDGKTITVTRYSGTSVSDTSLTGTTVNGGYWFAFTPAAAGTTVYKVDCGSLTTQYLTVTVAASDVVEKGYKLDGVKNLDIEKNYNSSLSTDASTNVTLYTTNAAGFKVQAVSSAAVSYQVTAPDKTVKTVTGGALALNTNGTIINETTGAYSIVAYVNGIAVATDTFTVSDSGSTPTVTLSSNQLTNRTVTLADIANCLSLPAGYTLVDVKYISGNTGNGVASRTAFTTPAPTTLFTATATTTLYNVTVKVQDGSGRTFVISNLGNIVVQ